jgi:site-specific recombinase XerD
MSAVNYELKPLSDSLMKEVIAYGILEVSLEQYQIVCNKIVTFASSLGVRSYSRDLLEKFLQQIDRQVAEGGISPEYRRFQKRVVRMLAYLAETGEVNFSRAHPPARKYPVSEEISALIECIFETNSIHQKAQTDLRAPMRHLFWYADIHGCGAGKIDNFIVMKFLIDEVPVTNSGSTGRTLRCIKYITEYLKTNGHTGLTHDYTMLKLKNAHIKIIPAFSENEIARISAAVDPDTPLGMRDLAVILLGYGTGLRGADIINLKLSDINWRRQCAKVVQSKTHMPLEVVLNGTILNALADYVLHARPKCNAPEVFLTVKAPYRRLSSNFAKMVDKYCEKSGVDKIPLRAFHSLRRAFETVMVSHGVPIETASRMMGHKTIGEDKPYITHNKEKASFVAMDFADVPVTSGLYAGIGHPSRREEVSANDI